MRISDWSSDVCSSDLRSVFGGEFVTAITFRAFGGEQLGLGGAMLDRIAHIALPLGSSLPMASDVTRPGDFKVGTNTSVPAETDGADEHNHVFTGRTDGRRLALPHQAAEPAETSGIFADRV